MGIEDGYRMIPVYLTGGIDIRSPASTPTCPRNAMAYRGSRGPADSGRAGVWRRAVQAEIDEHCPRA